MPRPALIVVLLVVACARDVAPVGGTDGDVGTNLDAVTDDGGPVDVAPDFLVDVPDDQGSHDVSEIGDAADDSHTSDDAVSDFVDEPDLAEDVPPEVAWWDQRFPYRLPLVVTLPASIDVSNEPLVDVPVLVEVDLSSIANHLPDNPAVYFTLDDGTGLDADVEYHDDTTLLAWVGLPDVQPDLRFWLYIGSTAAIGLRSPWNPSYELVLHMKDDSGLERDRSTNRRDADVISDSPRAVPSAVGPGYELDGDAGDYLRVPYDSDEPWDTTETLTVSAWVRRTDDSNDWLLNRWHQGRDSWGLILANVDDNSDGEPVAGVSNDGSGGLFASGGTPVELDTWTWIAFTFELGTVRVYHSGQLDHETTAGFTQLYPVRHPIYIGRLQTGSSSSTSEFVGGIDEVRIENVARSPQWMHFQFLSMTRQVVTVGAWEAR